MAEHALDSKMGFGKHRYKTVQAVIDTDPGYLEWALENAAWFTLTDNARGDLASADMTPEFEDAAPFCNYGDGRYPN